MSPTLIQVLPDITKHTNTCLISTSSEKINNVKLNYTPTETWIFNAITEKNENILGCPETSVSGMTNPEYGEINNLITENRHLYNSDILKYQRQEKWDLWKIIPNDKRRFFKLKFEYVIQNKKGQSIHILEENLIYSQNNFGDITHVIVFCVDITCFETQVSTTPKLISIINGEELPIVKKTNSSLSHIKVGLLTKRQVQIVELLSRGACSKQIADKLCISIHTVNTHRRKLIEKTGAKNTCNLIAFAKENYLI